MLPGSASIHATAVTSFARLGLSRPASIGQRVGVVDLDEVRGLVVALLVSPVEPARVIDTIVASGVAAADMVSGSATAGHVAFRDTDWELRP
jgi:hypothetical protein